jgi:hypothetical protein
VFLFFLQKNDANVFFVLVFACLGEMGLQIEPVDGRGGPE